MNSGFAAHEKAVAQLANRLELEGYSVSTTPKEEDVPFSLGGYVPDLVATKPGDNLIVEIKLRSNPRDLERYRRVIATVEAHPGWRFLLQTISDLEQPERTPTTAPLDVTAIQSYIAKTSKILEAGIPELAIPYLWNAIIALLRVEASVEGVSYDDIADRSLINRVYSSGLISSRDHERLLNWNRLRNEVVHSTAPEVDAQTVDEIADYVATLLAGLESKQAGQGGAGQPATLSESDSEGEDKPQPNSEGRSQ